MADFHHGHRDVVLIRIFQCFKTIQKGRGDVGSRFVRRFFQDRGDLCIREKLKYSDVPPPLRGLGITFITVGLMAMAFMAFGGI